MKQLRLKLALVAILLSFALTPASAYDFEVDGFYYNVVSLSDLTCEVTSGNNKYVGNIAIPAEVVYKGKTFSVKAVGKFAFAQCTELTGVLLPVQTDELGDSAFMNCSSLTDIVIPQSVTTIGAYCFGSCSELTSCQLPNSSTLGSGAFYCCKKLKSIVLPAGLASIGEKTFYDCNSLENIDIPASVKNIGKSAFQYSGLTKVSIPFNVEKIGAYAFDNCGRLKEFTLDDAGNNISIGGNPFSGTPIQKVYIGRNVSTGTSDKLFYNKTDLQEVTFGKNVTRILNYDYYGCKSLRKISIPSNIQTIGHQAFAHTGITTIFIEDGCETLELFCPTSDIGIVFYDAPIDTVYCGRNIHGVYTEKQDIFKGVKKLIFGNYVSNIDFIKFDNYTTTLTDLQVGENLATLPDLTALSQLKTLSLTRTTPPAAPAFTNAQYLKLIVCVPVGAKNAYTSADVWKNFWELKEDSTLLPSLTYNGLLYKIISDTEAMVIRDTDPYAGDIVVPATASLRGRNYAVVSIGDAFKNSEVLTSIKLPSTIEELRNNSFSGCTKLSSIQFPTTISAIPGSCFSGCVSLKNIELPSSVISINQKAFMGCDSLEAMQFPENLRSVWNNAFENCKSLGTVVFNSSLETIGAAVFKGCTKLQQVEMNCKIEDLSDSLFYGCALKTIELPSSIKNISSCAFAYSSLTLVSLPSQLQTIGRAAFLGCSSLNEISIPGSCASIGDNAFNYCDSLVSVTFEESDTPITLGSGYGYELSSSVYQWPDPTTVDEACTGLRNGLYRGLFYELPIEKLVINRNIVNAKYYERIKGNPTSKFQTVYNDFIYYPPFYGLTSLKEVEIGENVTAICQNTIEAVVSTKATIMDYTNFGGCYRIETVTSKNSVAPIGGGFTSTVYSKATLVLPNGGEESYKADDYWKKFLNVQTTGILNIKEEATHNGMSGIYDLQGRKLREPQKGINIIDGKKILIK